MYRQHVEQLLRERDRRVFIVFGDGDSGAGTGAVATVAAVPGTLLGVEEGDAGIRRAVTIAE